MVHVAVAAIAGVVLMLTLMSMSMLLYTVCLQESPRGKELVQRGCFPKFLTPPPDVSFRFCVAVDNLLLLLLLLLLEEKEVDGRNILKLTVYLVQQTICYSNNTHVSLLNFGQHRGPRCDRSNC